MGQSACALPQAVLLDHFLICEAQFRVHDWDCQVQLGVGEWIRLPLRGHGGW